MSRFPAGTLIEVAAIQRHAEDESVVIGAPGVTELLVVPPDVVELLDHLAAGLTVGAAAEAYRQRHGETPDMEDLLQGLADAGIVRARVTPQVGAAAQGNASDAPTGTADPTSGNLPWLSQDLARRIVSWPVLATCGGVIVAALAAAALDPGSVPGFRAAYFPESLATIGPALLAAILVMVAVHELAHLVAARAAGVACRFGLGHRLWILVAETDMTGVWLVPRRARFLPFLAGPLADAVGASLALLLLFACRHEWCSLPDGALTLVRATFVAYIFALLWQCYFFVRTDFYYVFSNLLRCRNLMADTEAYLRGLLARVSSRFRPFPMSELPAHERLAVRLYAPVWLVGRGLAFGLLFFVQLPLLWSYLGAGLRAWHSPTGAPSSPTTVLLALVMVTVPLAGLGLWMRSLNQSWRSR